MKNYRFGLIVLCFLFVISIASCEDKKESEPELPNNPIIPEDTKDTIIPTIDEFGICIDKEVDLGLSVKWAGYNVGANLPEEFGNHYAWGEIDVKDEYSQLTYEHWQPSSYTNDGVYKTLGGKIDGTKYDVATQLWSEGWRLPTYKEAGELNRECTWTMINYKNVLGFKVVGPNGNAIFLPCAGYYYNSEYIDPLQAGLYWTGDICIDYDGYAGCFGFSPQSGHSVGLTFRYIGMTIRPVK